MENSQKLAILIYVLQEGKSREKVFSQHLKYVQVMSSRG